MLVEGGVPSDPSHSGMPRARVRATLRRAGPPHEASGRAAEPSRAGHSTGVEGVSRPASAGRSTAPAHGLRAGIRGAERYEPRRRWSCRRPRSGGEDNVGQCPLRRKHSYAPEGTSPPLSRLVSGNRRKTDGGHDLRRCGEVREVSPNSRTPRVISCLSVRSPSSLRRLRHPRAASSVVALPGGTRAAALRTPETAVHGPAVAVRRTAVP